MCRKREKYSYLFSSEADPTSQAPHSTFVYIRAGWRARETRRDTPGRRVDREKKKTISPKGILGGKLLASPWRVAIRRHPLFLALLSLPSHWRSLYPLPRACVCVPFLRFSAPPAITYHVAILSPLAPRLPRQLPVVTSALPRWAQSSAYPIPTFSCYASFLVNRCVSGNSMFKCVGGTKTLK